MTNLLAEFSVRFNASMKRCDEVLYVPYSNLNVRVVKLLFKYKAISTFSMDICYKKQRFLIKITPLYVLSEPLIRGFELVSKPSRRVYWTANELSRKFARNNFQGFYIISTPRGMCSSNELVMANILDNAISGEILMKIHL